MDRTFEEAYKDWTPPASILDPLPLAHVMTLSDFSLAVTNGELRPPVCDVFSQNFLYLTYGAAHYRPKSGPNRALSSLPVAIIFDSKVADRSGTVIPLDSGALNFLPALDCWKARFQPYPQAIAICTHNAYVTANHLVQMIYQSNEAYMLGSYDRCLKGSGSPWDELDEYLSADLQSSGVDQRQFTIECLFVGPQTLNIDIWVALPQQQQAVDSLERLISKFPNRNIKPLYYFAPIVKDDYSLTAVIADLMKRKVIDEHYVK